MNACSGSDANIDRSGEVDKSGSLVLIRGSLKASTSPNYPICQQPHGACPYRGHKERWLPEDQIFDVLSENTACHASRLDGTRFVGSNQTLNLLFGANILFQIPRNSIWFSLRKRPRQITKIWRFVVQNCKVTGTSSATFVGCYCCRNVINKEKSCMASAWLLRVWQTSLTNEKPSISPSDRVSISGRCFGLW